MGRRCLRSTPPLNYESFLKKNLKYDGKSKCFVYDCQERALYEGGDSRFYCGMCEEHAAMRGKYRMYLQDFYPSIQSNLTNEQIYDFVMDRYAYFNDKIAKALEEENGPKFGET